MYFDVNPIEIFGNDIWYWSAKVNESTIFYVDESSININSGDHYLGVL